MRKSDSMGVFYDLVKKNSDVTAVEDLTVFARWFTVTAYQCCKRNFANIRTNRYKKIWIPETSKNEADKVKRSRGRKKTVS